MDRFIPAPAGNSCVVLRRCTSAPVHPRACGEQPGQRCTQRHPGGSSPRLRGTVCGGSLGLRLNRFIPAPAGNRSGSLGVSGGSSVHPRACGEQAFVNEESNRRHGSSPRLRGTEAKALVTAYAGRFIPAPAGNSHSDSYRNRNRPVHPRACGEQAVADVNVNTHPGSSPRLRGTAQVGRRQARFRRFIPAPAGNRSIFQEDAMTGSVHPRACGEQFGAGREDFR